MPGQNGRPGGNGDFSPKAGEDVDIGEARAALERILESPDFDASERNRAFLRHVIEETLAGRGKQLKGYSIAVEVFGRDDGFDPQIDPVVRIEASRLRRSLERYYLLSGQADAIRIEIPKGGYVPQFVRCDDPEAVATMADGDAAPVDGESAAPPPRGRQSTRMSAVAIGAVTILAVALAAYLADWPKGQSVETARTAPSQLGAPVILVLPFTDEADPTSALSATLARLIATGLTRFETFDVHDVGSNPANGVVPSAMAAEVAADFVLTGSVRHDAGELAVEVVVKDVRTDRWIWAEQLGEPIEPDGMMPALDRATSRLVRTLGAPHGVIMAEGLRRIEGQPTETLRGYGCVLRFYRYTLKYEKAAYRSVRTCLEQTVEDHPGNARALAALAMIEADGYRLGFDTSETAPRSLERALDHALAAVVHAPSASYGQAALHLVHWLRNDVERSLAAGERGILLNPNDSHLMAELGLRYCLLTFWDRCRFLMDKASEQDQLLPTHYRIGPFLHDYMVGRYEHALIEARRIRLPDLTFGFIACAMAHAALGQRQEAAAAIDQLLAIDPAFGSHVVDDMVRRNLHPELIAAIVDGLAKAGLAISEAQTRNL